MQKVRHDSCHAGASGREKMLHFVVHLRKDCNGRTIRSVFSGWVEVKVGEGPVNAEDAVFQVGLRVCLRVDR